MSNSFMRVDEVAEELGVSISYAYKVVKKLNVELNKLGYLTVSGRVSKQYFLEKACYSKRENEKEKEGK
jgi:DNA-binding transcriptional regulator GbsR (MarR family)